MKSERENARIFRSVNGGPDAPGVSSPNLGRALDRLKALLEVRETISREIGGAFRNANAENVRASERIRTASKVQAVQARVANERFRAASAATQVQEAKNRTVSVERAKQLLASVKRDLRGDPETVLFTLDDRLKEKKLERLRHHSSPSSAREPSLQRTATTAPPPLHHTFKSSTKSSSPSFTLGRSLKSNSSAQKSENLSQVRRSIDSIRRRSWDIEMDQLRHQLASEEPERERMDPSRIVERKRATLAALKLKSRKS